MNVDGDIVTKSFEIENFDDLLNDLITEIEIQNYRVTRIYDIDNVLDQTERGLSTSISFSHYKIVEFCNLNSCAEMLTSDPLAGVFMPVKFVAYQLVDNPKPRVSFLRPTSFARLFSSKGVMDIAEKLEEDMNNVLEGIAH